MVALTSSTHNPYLVTGWGARKLTAWSSASVRLDFSQWFDIHGADPRLNPMVVPTADPDRQGGHRLDLLLGLNVFANEGRLSGLRLGLEGGLPLYQHLNGPQLKTTWMIQASIEKTF
jgi:hypothetical protein